MELLKEETESLKIVKDNFFFQNFDPTKQWI